MPDQPTEPDDPVTESCPACAGQLSVVTADGPRAELVCRHCGQELICIPGPVTLAEFAAVLADDGAEALR